MIGGRAKLRALGTAVTLAATVVASPGAAQDISLPRVNPEAPVTAVDLRQGQVAHNSPMLAGDPTDARLLALASRIDAPGFGCSLHVSRDGGSSWLPAQPVPRLPEGADRCYAPEVAFDSKGRLYFLFVGLQGEGNRPMGVFLTTSDDQGRSFTKPRRVLGPERYMVRLAVDPAAGGRGRLHLAWLEAASDPPLGGLPPTPNPIMASFSDDGGRSFSAPTRVSDPDRQRVVAPALAIGPGRAVHVLYYDLGDDARDYQGLEGPTWEGTWSLVLASSDDGGRRFGRHSVVDDAVVPPERVLLIFTMPPASLAATPEGRLFAAWHDARNGDWDVFLGRSVDGGRLWEDPVRVNDDELGNGRHQYLPRLASSPGGRLDAVFYDRRGDPANRRHDVYYAFSGDSGHHFAPNQKLTTRSSDPFIGQRYPLPSKVPLVELGSRLGLLSSDASVVAAWADTRNSSPGTQQDVFSARVEFPGVPAAQAHRRVSEQGPSAPILGVAVVVGAGLAVLAGGAVVRHRRKQRA